MQNTAYISDLLKQVTFKEGAKLLHFKDYTGKSGYIAIKAPAGNYTYRSLEDTQLHEGQLLGITLYNTKQN